MSKLFIFIGRSGCGKGTQVDLLKQVLTAKEPSRPILHVETGKLLRDFTAKSGYSNDLTRQAMAAGERMPDFLAVQMWAQALTGNFTGQENLIFDGSPRSLLEAQTIDTVGNFYPDLQPTIIYLNISRATAVARLQGRGRADDQVKSIENRLDWFDRDVLPAVEHFRATPLYQFLDIDGEPSVEEIHRDIVAKLNL